MLAPELFMLELGGRFRLIHNRLKSTLRCGQGISAFSQDPWFGFIFTWETLPQSLGVL
jgi:hypothetical protein